MCVCVINVLVGMLLYKCVSNGVSVCVNDTKTTLSLVFVDVCVHM